MHASISPCRILTSESDREVTNLGLRRWSSSRSDCWLGPVSSDEVLMPTQNGRWLHDQHHLVESCPGEGCGQYCQDGPVGFGEPGTCDLALQNKDLVAQSENLSVAFVAGGDQPSQSREKQLLEHS